MVKKRKTPRKKAAKTGVQTKKGKLVGFTKVGSKLALVFKKNNKLVVGSARFKNRTTLKARVKKIIK